jgi:Mor family transcriptional regulator
MKVDMIRMLDDDVGELVEVFIPVMLAWTRKTLIPELYEVFGPEQLMRFLDLFAGTRFEVPSRDVILQALRDADVYVRLAAGRDTVRDLATKYGVAEHQVADAYARVAAIIGAARIAAHGARPPSPEAVRSAPAG